MKTKHILNAIRSLEINSTEEDFTRVFGPVGKHLWAKFQAHHGELLRLYQTLDSENSALLEGWIEDTAGNKPYVMLVFTRANKEEDIYLTAWELKDAFIAWLHKKEINWINNYSTGSIFKEFTTTDDNGLLSVFDEKQYPQIEELLYPILSDYEMEKRKEAAL